MLMMTARGLLASSSGPAFYVDNAASGANNGTSWANAWTSFPAINWGAITPGATIYISGGATSKTYSGNGIILGASGTAAAPIRIRRGIGAGHNGTPILDGLNVAPNWYGVDNGWAGPARNHVRVSGLSLRNFSSAGLHSRNSTAGIVFTDCSVLCGSNTLIFPDGDVPRGVDMRQNTGATLRRLTVTTPTNVANQTDCFWLLGENDWLVENCHAEVSNVDNSQHSDAFQTFECGSGIVRYNTFITSAIGANDNKALWISHTDNGATVQVYSNLIISRGHGGPTAGVIRDDDLAGHGTVLFDNNTIYGGHRCFTTHRYTNIKIRNNILWPDAGGAAFAYATLVTDPAPGDVTNNLVWAPSSGIFLNAAAVERTYTQWTETDGYNAGGVNANPLFIAAGTNFQLQPGSPALNAGVTIATVSADIRGFVRPVGAAYDIGAYEGVGETGENLAPLLILPLEDQFAREGDGFSYPLRAGSFSDPESGALTYTATLNSGAPLPSWLTFTAATQTFSGTPPIGAAGTITVRVRATDPGGLSIVDDFTITIAPASAPWAPTDFPGLTGWWSMTTHAGQIDGTDLVQFTDLRGGGRHFDQRATGNLPKKRTIATYPAADFLASNSESMDNAGTLATFIGDVGLCAVVVELNGVPNSTAGNWYDNPGIVADAGGYWGIAAVNVAGITPSIRCGIWDGTSKMVALPATPGVRHLVVMYRVIVNLVGELHASIDGGAETVLGTVGAPQTQTGAMRLGVNWNLAAYFNGRIHEIVTSTANGASGDRTDLIAYLKTKWGVA